MITTKNRETERPATGTADETKMKAVVQHAYGTADVLELREIDKPTMGANEVLIRVRAAGVNVADWAIMSGLPYIARPMYGPGKPKNPVRGTDVAGEVEAIGPGVTRFRPGDQVFGWSGHLGGAFAEYASVSEDSLVSKPTKLTFVQGLRFLWRGRSPSWPFAVARSRPGRKSSSMEPQEASEPSRCRSRSRMERT
jgi:hypothetical protein